jgi:hypothetical protein
MTRSLESTRNFCMRKAGERVVEKNLMKISMKITFRAPATTTRSFIPSLSDEAFFFAAAAEGNNPHRERQSAFI